MTRVLHLAGVLLLSACEAERRAPEKQEAPMATPALMELRRLDSQTVEAHLGMLVVVEGVYTPRAVRMRPPSAKHTASAEPKPRTVSLEGEGGSVMLEVYYSPAGVRPEEELSRFEGKRVRVAGRLDRTPVRTHEGIPMATMTGPYLGDIRSITLVSP